MSMREKMARAGYMAGMHAFRKHQRSPLAVLPWEETIPEQREMFYAMADGALDALMEPTDEMLGAAYLAVDQDFCEARGLKCFEAMIKAAKNF